MDTLWPSDEDEDGGDAGVHPAAASLVVEEDEGDDEGDVDRDAPGEVLPATTFEPPDVVVARIEEVTAELARSLLISDGPPTVPPLELAPAAGGAVTRKRLFSTRDSASVIRHAHRRGSCAACRLT